MPLGQGAFGRQAKPLFSEARGARDFVAQIEQRGEFAGPGRVVGQVGNEFVLQAVAVPGLVMVQKLHLHFGHVNAGRAVALAAFATHA